MNPGDILASVFVLSPDRDVRASQLCAETFLTLVANGYEAGGDLHTTPKLKRFALRSLVFEENFLTGLDINVTDTEMSAVDFGRLLASGEDFDGSANLHLMRDGLRSLVDPQTADRSRAGERLLRPFHEAFLWYDARWGNGRFTTRKVLMRGQGITLARLLMTPPHAAGPVAQSDSEIALNGLRNHLSSPTPLSEMCARLDACLGVAGRDLPPLENDEKRSWEVGDDERLSPLASGLTRHVAGVVSQGGASPASMLWQTRSMLALDLAVNALRISWDVTQEDAANRCLLVASSGFERSEDSVRLAAERSLSLAKTSLTTAVLIEIERRLGDILTDVARSDVPESVAEALPLRSRRAFLARLSQRGPGKRRVDPALLAQLLVENIEGFGRAASGFRVLLDSIGMLSGGNRYSYVSLSADVLSALVGALANELPMTSEKFFQRVEEEWSLVISPGAAEGRWVGESIDGEALSLNAKRFERRLIEAGLATNLSDRTVLVGEVAGRRSS